MPAIEQQELTFATLPEVDPTIAVLFKKLMRDLYRDCENRPYDDTARTCALKFKLVPVLDESTGELDYIDLVCEGKPSIPVYRTGKVQIRVNQGRGYFNRDLPDAIDQRPLFKSEGNTQ